MFCTMSPLDFSLLRTFTISLLYIRPSTVVFSPQPFVGFPLFILCGHAPRALHNASLESFDRRRFCAGQLPMFALAHLPVCGRCHEIDAEPSHFFLFLLSSSVVALLSVCSILSFSHSCCFSYFPTYTLTHNN